ncbi:type IV pilin protein [Acinetobacter brisouii]
MILGGKFTISSVKQYGFTLIELMITVVIIAILAAIAIPSYLNHIKASHRTDVQASMMNLAQYLESQYNASFSYPASTAIPTSLTAPSNISSYYTITVDTGSGQAYTITATPTSNQNDTQCGTLTLNEKGAKTPTTTGCWK